jgi:tRNA (guanine37-N1)-methyltransferase
VLGNINSLNEESFNNGLLEYAHYTKPRSFRGMKVPETLMSGNHKLISEWRKKSSIKRTEKFRSDLLYSNKKEE